MTTFEFLYAVVPFNLSKPWVIGAAAVCGLFLSRWKWVLVAATIVAVVENVALNIFAGMIFGWGTPGSPFRSPGIYVLDLGSSVFAYLVWATAFFFLKQLASRV